MQIWAGNGNIVSEIKLLGQNGKIATTGIAVERDMKDMSGKWITDFLTLRFLGEKQVARAQKELTVGTHADVQGKVCKDSYTDRNGEKRYVDYILVSQFRSVRRASSNSEEDGGIKDDNEETPDNKKTEEFINIPDNVSDDGMPFN